MFVLTYSHYFDLRKCITWPFYDVLYDAYSYDLVCRWEYKEERVGDLTVFRSRGSTHRSSPLRGYKSLGSFVVSCVSRTAFFCTIGRLWLMEGRQSLGHSQSPQPAIEQLSFFQNALSSGDGSNGSFHIIQHISTSFNIFYLQEKTGVPWILACFCVPWPSHHAFTGCDEGSSLSAGRRVVKGQSVERRRLWIGGFCLVKVNKKDSNSSLGHLGSYVGIFVA